MKDDRLLEPIKYYNDFLKEQLKNKLEEEYDKLVQTSGVDKEKNNKEIEEYIYNHNKAAEAKNNKAAQKKLIILLAIAFILFILFKRVNDNPSNFFESAIFKVVVVVSCIFLIIFLIAKMTQNDEINEKYSGYANDALCRAKDGMECFFNLFSEEKYIEIINSVLPSIKLYKIIPKSFEKYLNQISDHPIDDFDYYFKSVADEDSCALIALYGTIEGKPFLFFKQKKFEMGEKTYVGSATYPYTDSYMDSDGEWHEETCYETIYASITMPFPMYNSSFTTLYFTDTAPNLHFHRYPFICNYDVESYVRSTVKKLNKKEKKEEAIYLADKEFEALFNVQNRNNDVEFRMMFTPYVIKNMKELIRSKVGPGNDFEYVKCGRISAVLYKNATVYEDHIIPSYSDVLNYSLEKTKQLFVEKGLLLFDSIYFSLAPILTIKLNSDGETINEDAKDINDTSFIINNYKHPFNAERLVYDNVDYIRPFGSVTDVIAKAEYISSDGEVNCFEINSSSFSVENKQESQYVVGCHVSGYVTVYYDEYYAENATNYLISSYLGLPTYFVRICMKEYQYDKLVYENGFFGLIVEEITKESVNRYKNIVREIQKRHKTMEE